MNTDKPRFTIRSARPADQRGIRALVREGGINPLGLHWSRFAVAVNVQGEIIGCGQVKEHRDASAELASIAVTRPYRRLGVGGAIIKALQNNHSRPIWLTCLNLLVPFYTQFHFREVHNLDQMPPYFRRARRFMTLYFRLRREEAYLAVMFWPGR